MIFSENEIKQITYENMFNLPNGVASENTITPLQRIQVMSPDEWEKFTLEIADYLKSKYSRVTQCGGKGDLGRDVIAYKPNEEWDNYQCKHYSKRLPVANAILEIAKVIYYSFKGEYTLPKNYFFVSPHGSSSDLIKLFQDTKKFKDILYSRWETDCKSKIKVGDVKLDKFLEEYIEEKVNFSIFKEIPPLELISIHRNTKYHTMWFGWYGVNRPPFSPTPSKIDEPKELTYITELLNAFSEYKSKPINLQNIEEDNELFKEYRGARNNFYSAESLERFSRDYLPENSFNELKDECYESISPTIKQRHSDGYERYLKTLEKVVSINYTSHPLNSFIKIQDKKGMCHQLVNDKEIKWTKDEK
jgi:hypothetical protein